ncbi:MAG: alpha-ketoglutarate-dependent dioxygenase AlkB [Pseudomonadota bacterium]
MMQNMLNSQSNALESDIQALVPIEFLTSPISILDADNLFTHLLNQTPWQEDAIEVYGRKFRIPRLQAWYANEGVNYRYSNNLIKTLPWTPQLLALKKQIEDSTGCRFNAVLLTLYRDGQDCVEWHADNERELGEDPWIASLSLGTKRIFQYRSNDNGHLEQCELVHGSLLLMSPEFQHYYQHQVPSQPEINAPRINLTFRYVVNQ